MWISLCVILVNSIKYGIMEFSGFYNMHALQCAHLGTGVHIAEAERFGEKNKETVEKTTKEELYYLGHSYDFILFFSLHVIFNMTLIWYIWCFQESK